jgi:hypothetical protein
MAIRARVREWGGAHAKTKGAQARWSGNGDSCVTHMHGVAAARSFRHHTLSAVPPRITDKAAYLGFELLASKTWHGVLLMHMVHSCLT